MTTQKTSKIWKALAAVTYLFRDPFLPFLGQSWLRIDVWRKNWNSRIWARNLKTATDEFWLESGLLLYDGRGGKVEPNRERHAPNPWRQLAARSDERNVLMDCFARSFESNVAVLSSIWREFFFAYFDVKYCLLKNVFGRKKPKFLRWCELFIHKFWANQKSLFHVKHHSGPFRPITPVLMNSNNETRLTAWRLRVCRIRRV